MSKYYILYNPKAKSGTGLGTAESVKKYATGDVEMVDITAIDDYADFLSGITDEDSVVICGGDGTLTRFINYAGDAKLPKNLYFRSAGTGNDFFNDIGAKPEDGPVEIGRYVKKLPKVTINGKSYKFINGIGYGIDGYCCEVGDAMREKSDKPVNYTSIAIKGLLFHFKPRNAKVTVDGVTKEYKKVWLAPTMNGRYYGGGMIPTPGQDRLKNDTVSTMVMYGKGKLKTLIVFPSIFKGEHVNHKDMVDVFKGKRVTVEFDRPTALQIDGETFLGVTSYTVDAPAE